jgi:hypothetical protein
MPENVNVDPKLLQPLESVMHCWALNEVPLLLAAASDQKLFVRSVPPILGGKVLYSNAPDAATQLLATIKSADYVYLVVEDRIQDRTLERLLCYYLDTRDIMHEDDPRSYIEFAQYPIDSGHRLLLIGSVDFWNWQKGTVLFKKMSEICTKIAMSR